MPLAWVTGHRLKIDTSSSLPSTTASGTGNAPPRIRSRLARFYLAKANANRKTLAERAEEPFVPKKAPMLSSNVDNIFYKNNDNNGGATTGRTKKTNQVAARIADKIEATRKSLVERAGEGFRNNGTKGGNADHHPNNNNDNGVLAVPVKKSSKIARELRMKIEKTRKSLVERAGETVKQAREIAGRIAEPLNNVPSEMIVVAAAAGAGAGIIGSGAAIPAASHHGNYFYCSAATTTAAAAASTPATTLPGSGLGQALGTIPAAAAEANNANTSNAPRRCRRRQDLTATVEENVNTTSAAAGGVEGPHNAEAEQAEEKEKEEEEGYTSPYSRWREGSVADCYDSDFEEEPAIHTPGINTSDYNNSNKQLTATTVFTTTTTGTAAATTPAQEEESKPLSPAKERVEDIQLHEEELKRKVAESHYKLLCALEKRAALEKTVCSHTTADCTCCSYTDGSADCQFEKTLQPGAEQLGALTPPSQEEQEEPEEKVVKEEVNKEETVKEEVVNEETVNEETVKEEVVNEETVNEETVNEETVKEETVKEETVKEETVKEEKDNSNNNNREECKDIEEGEDDEDTAKFENFSQTGAEELFSVFVNSGQEGTAHYGGETESLFELENFSELGEDELDALVNSNQQGEDSEDSDSLFEFENFSELSEDELSVFVHQPESASVKEEGEEKEEFGEEEFENFSEIGADELGQPDQQPEKKEATKTAAAVIAPEQNTAATAANTIIYSQTVSLQEIEGILADEESQAKTSGELAQVQRIRSAVFSVASLSGSTGSSPPSNSSAAVEPAASQEEHQEQVVEAESTSTVEPSSSSVSGDDCKGEEQHPDRNLGYFDFGEDSDDGEGSHGAKEPAGKGKSKGAYLDFDDIKYLTNEPEPVYFLRGHTSINSSPLPYGSSSKGKKDHILSLFDSKYEDILVSSLHFTEGGTPDCTGEAGAAVSNFVEAQRTELAHWESVKANGGNKPEGSQTVTDKDSKKQGYKKDLGKAVGASLETYKEEQEYKKDLEQAAYASFETHKKEQEYQRNLQKGISESLKTSNTTQKFDKEYPVVNESKSSITNNKKKEGFCLVQQRKVSDTSTGNETQSAEFGSRETSASPDFQESPPPERAEFEEDVNTKDFKRETKSESEDSEKEDFDSEEEQGEEDEEDSDSEDSGSEDSDSEDGSDSDDPPDSEGGNLSGNTQQGFESPEEERRPSSPPSKPTKSSSESCVTEKSELKDQKNTVEEDSSRVELSPPEYSLFRGDNFGESPKLDIAAAQSTLKFFGTEKHRSQSESVFKTEPTEPPEASNPTFEVSSDFGATASQTRKVFEAPKVIETSEAKATPTESKKVSSFTRKKNDYSFKVPAEDLADLSWLDKVRSWREDSNERKSCWELCAGPKLKLIKGLPNWKLPSKMAPSEYPESQRRAYNHTPGDLDQDEGGASLSEIAVPPFNSPELQSPSPFPRLESPKREEEFVTQIHHEEEYESPYVGRAETTEGDLSMPVEHMRHLMDMDSSFRATEGEYEDEDSQGKIGVSSPQNEEEYLDEPDEEEEELEPESPVKGRRLSALSSLHKTATSFRKADSSFGQDDEDDFDDFSMIHPEQTPSLKSRKSFLTNLQKNLPSTSNNVSNSNKLKQLGDMPPPLPPLNRINSRSTQRRLERSYSHTSSESKLRTRKFPDAIHLPSSDSFDMSSPLPQHQPSSDTEFAPSSPIVSAQSRRKLQQSYSSEKHESPPERPLLTGRLHRSESTASTKSATRRPKFLKSRHSSTRSSISSVHSNAYKQDEEEDEINENNNEDGASTVLGTKNEKAERGKGREVSPMQEKLFGESYKEESRNRDVSGDRDGSRDFYDSKGDTENFGGPLSRTTSLGSIASGVTGLGQSMVAEAAGQPLKLRHQLDTVKEVKSGVDDDGNDSDDGAQNPPLPPETVLEDGTDSEHDSDVEAAKVPLPQESPNEPRTPQNSKPRMPNPSMTAISARVSQIQIPATVAKQFYAMENKPYPASARKLQLEQYGKQEAKTPGKDMTLKEQNAVIDKLHKQVFDLKLRCFFLDQKLQNTSEEGMDSLRQENVDLKVQIAGLKKEIKLLKREIKELKAQGAKAFEEDTEGEEGEGGEMDNRRDLEIFELRERCERYEGEIERLRRKVAIDAAAASSEGVQDVVDIMSEMLENETLKREQAQKENNQLRDHILELQRQLSGHQSSVNLQPPPMARRASTTSYSDGLSNAGGSNLTTTNNSRGAGGSQNIDTANLMERLRSENDELRRDLGAQTSMLTTRNKERDQLYQEIEDLKLNMRTHGTLRPAGSSANMGDQLGLRLQHLHHGGGTERSASRNSFAGSSTAVMAEEERENMENMNGKLRDKISELKLAKGELELQLQSALRELQEYDMRWEQQAETNSLLRNEIREVTHERDAVIQERDQALVDFEDLRAEAEEELEKLEIEIANHKQNLVEYDQELDRVEDALARKQEDYDALSREMTELNDHVIALEDDRERMKDDLDRMKTKIELLEKQSKELEQEIEVMEKKLNEEEQNAQRLNVQLESAHGQITFLNEELDGDKIKIGQLESNLKKAEEQIREERDKAREWERRCGDERRRAEKERERRSGESEGVKELEKRLNEKEKDFIQKDDEVHRLRKTIAKRETEAQTWRDRLEEVEGALREALGDVTGTKENLLESIQKLQAQLDATLEELDATKRRLGERERTLRDRENLLESMAIESKKLTEILEKERLARKHDKNQVDNLENKHQHTRQKLSQHEIQFKELQQARNREARDTQNLENKLREQINERNALLTTVWSRLSILLGPTFAHRNSHVVTVAAEQGTMPMEMAVIQAFVGFSRHMMNAVKGIESIISGFKAKCKQVERDVMKELQLLESAIDSKTKRLERMEHLVRGGLGESAGLRAEVAKLKSENRLLKVDNAKLGGSNLGYGHNGVGTPPPAGRDKRRSTGHTVERSSQLFDAAASSNTATPSAAVPSSNNTTNTRDSTNTNTPQTAEKAAPKSTTSKARELFGAFTRSSKPAASASTSTPPPVNNHNNNNSHNSIPTSSPHSQTTTSTTALPNATLIVTEPQDESSSKEPGDGTDPITQKLWIRRLRELEKRLKSEREARILDRSGAKKRLEEEREQKEVLKKELEREKEKWLSVDTPGVEGPKERLSIEDVKWDEHQQHQSHQPQSSSFQQISAAASVSNTGSVRGRESRTRRGSISTEQKPRRSSRSRHPLPPPVAGPSTEFTTNDQPRRERGVSRPRAPAPEEQYRGRGATHPTVRGMGSQEEQAQSSTHEYPKRERGMSRHRGANGGEESREERKERKEREREERRLRKEREGSWRGDKREVLEGSWRGDKREVLEGSWRGDKREVLSGSSRGDVVISPDNSGLGSSQLSGGGY